MRDWERIWRGAGVATVNRRVRLLGFGVLIAAVLMLALSMSRGAQAAKPDQATT